jgi:hypothetical protein
MPGASQSVNVLVFQFSGPDKFLSAQPLFRSLTCGSNFLSFSSSLPCCDGFYVAREWIYASFPVMRPSTNEASIGGRSGKL